MSADSNELIDLGDRLARVRRMYGEHIDLPNLGREAFAALLGVSAIAYEAFERGDRAPSADFLAALRSKTSSSLD